MGKGVLKDVQKTTEIKVKSMKPLQTLSVSSVTEEKNIKSGSLSKDTKITACKKRQTKTQKAIIVAEKENTPILLRRSKRKVVNPCDGKNNEDLPTKPKTVKSNAKKVKSGAKSKLTVEKHPVPVLKEEKVDIQNKYTTSSPKDLKSEDISRTDNCDKNVLINSPSVVSNDSGFESSSRVSDQIIFQRTVVVYSPDTRVSPSAYDVSDLISESPSLNYWMDLAEQRRIALEKALLENESLHDQLCVLQAENSQLKAIVNLSDKLAELIQEEIQ